MDNRSKRIHTFKNWTLSTHVWPHQLSTAGFFYTGEGAHVKCASCGVITSVDSWERKERPEIVHYCLNNECKFLKSNFPNLKDTIEKEKLEVLLQNINTSNELSEIQHENLKVNCKVPTYEPSTELSNGTTEINEDHNSHVDNTGIRNEETLPFIPTHMKNISQTHLRYYSPNKYAVATHPNMQQYVTTEQNSSSKISSEIGNRQVEMEVCQNSLTISPIAQTRNTVNEQKLFKDCGNAEKYYGDYTNNGQEGVESLACNVKTLDTNTERTFNNSVNTTEHCNQSLNRRENMQKNASDGSTMDSNMYNSVVIDQPTTTIHTGTNQSTICLSDLSHPNFRDYQDRLKSYTTWPEHERQPPEILAKCGFFYTGDSDVVRCFCCNVGLSEWAAADDPWIEHARHSPKCWFLCTEKGQPFIDKVQEEWKQRYKPTNPVFDDYVSRLATFDGWGDDVKQTPDMLAEAGFFFIGEEDIVRCHYCDGGLKNWEEGDIPWEEHARCFPYCKFLIKMKGNRYINSVKKKYKHQQVIVKNSTQEVSRKPTVVNIELTSNNLLCMVCKKGERCMLFTNCGHQVTCELCCYTIDCCPHCDKKIKRIIRTTVK